MNIKYEDIFTPDANLAFEFQLIEVSEGESLEFERCSLARNRVLNVSSGLGINGGSLPFIKD